MSVQSWPCSASVGRQPLSQPPQRMEGSSRTLGPAELCFLYQAVCRRVHLVVGQHFIVFTALTTPTLQGSLASLNFGACWQPSSKPLDQYQRVIQYEKSSCISRVGATEGGIVITWSVFLRHPCPGSPTAEPGPSMCFLAGCGVQDLTAKQWPVSLWWNESCWQK